MSLFIASLNSGSNGNCYYVGNDQEAVLLDVGITCKEVEKRMARLGLDMRRVKAIFVSHEHSDHISGLAVTATRYQLPVYITTLTYRNTSISLQKDQLIPFHATAPVQIGRLTVKAFRKFHDASDPHSFTVSCSGVCVGVFTDIGNPCEELVNHFKQCHAAILESNYDEQMLQNGRYPYFLKNRIRGGLGHLSNDQAFQLFTGHRPSFMSHLLLAHLSRENNDPRIVENLFRSHASDTHIIVASRDCETPVFEITDRFVSATPRAIRPVQQRKVHQVQLSLFN